MAKIIYFFKHNWFLFGVFASVFFGYYYPTFPEAINKNGYFLTLLIILIFFIQGLTIQKEKLFDGLKNIKLHIFILFYTFIFFPAYIFIAVKIFPFINYNEGIVAGLFALACLPTTIVISSVFVGVAGGNETTAVFNIVVSNIIGVFFTPVILSILLGKSTLALPLSMVLEILKSLFVRIIIPMGLGMIVRNFAITFLDNNKKKFSLVSNFAVLFVVYTAFGGSSDSITMELIKNLYPVFIFLALTYLFISFIVYKTAGLMKFETGDKIAALFTTAQKTLSMGVTLITLYFINNKEILGIILIPLLFYHPWQIIMANFIANYLKNRTITK